MSTTSTAHICLDDSGMAWIDDTNVKVIEVVLDHLAHGWSAEEIHFQHPSLSMGQIHAALSYYYDHQSTLDAEIAHRLSAADRLRATAGESLFQRRLQTGRP